MFAICFLICFIIHGDSAIGQKMDIDSPKDFLPIDKHNTDMLSIEDTRQYPQNHLIPDTIEGRAKQRLIKGKLKLILKTLILFKLLLFIVSLPLSAITAKFLSWNAVVISLLALVTSKLLLLRSIFPGPTGSSAMPPTPPIIIQSSSDPIRRTRGGPKIFIQHDPLIHDLEEDAHRRKRW